MSQLARHQLSGVGSSQRRSPFRSAVESLDIHDLKRQQPISNENGYLSPSRGKISGATSRPCPLVSACGAVAAAKETADCWAQAAAIAGGDEHWGVWNDRSWKWRSSRQLACRTVYHRQEGNQAKVLH